MIQKDPQPVRLRVIMHGWFSNKTNGYTPTLSAKPK